jgi:hypothetical protein
MLKRQTRDSRTVPVQVAFRVPYWYWAQLDEKANELKVSVPTLIADAVQRTYKPIEPPDIDKQ